MNRAAVCLMARRAKIIVRGDAVMPGVLAKPQSHGTGAGRGMAAHRRYGTIG